MISTAGTNPDNRPSRRPDGSEPSEGFPMVSRIMIFCLAEAQDRSGSDLSLFLSRRGIRPRDPLSRRRGRSSMLSSPARTLGKVCFSEKGDTLNDEPGCFTSLLSSASPPDWPDHENPVESSLKPNRSPLPCRIGCPLDKRRTNYTEHKFHADLFDSLFRNRGSPF